MSKQKIAYHTQNTFHRNRDLKCNSLLMEIILICFLSAVLVLCNWPFPSFLHHFCLFCTINSKYMFCKIANGWIWTRALWCCNHCLDCCTFFNRGAVVVGQTEEQAFPTQENPSSNPAVIKFYTEHFLVLMDWKCECKRHILDEQNFCFQLFYYLGRLTATETVFIRLVQILHWPNSSSYRASQFCCFLQFGKFC